jgi:hypothetical protein
LRVTVSLDGQTVDQLEFKVSWSKGVPVDGIRRPKQAAGSLADHQVVEIYLPDTVDGGPSPGAVTLEVNGYFGNKNQATVIVNSTKLKMGVLIPVSISLGGKKDGGASEVADGRPDGAEVTDALTDTNVVDAAGDLDPNDLPLKQQGQACRGPDECYSGLCVDGICCLSTCDMCQSCNVAGSEGTCVFSPMGKKTATCTDQGVAVPCGYNGTCDGKGGCFRPLAGQMCKAASCQGTTLIPPSACDGEGNCIVPINVNCAPYQCSGTAGPHCGTSCQSQAECAAGAQCNANSCGQRPKKATGAGCVADSECMSNFCTDGVCCGARCNTQCMSCNQAGQLGNCRAVPANQPDPRGMCMDTGVASCGTNGRCSGSSACAHYPAGTQCQAAQCLAHAVIGVRKCDAAGTCAPVPNVECAPFRCNPATTTCFTSCTADAQCARASGNSCKNGVCR